MIGLSRIESFRLGTFDFRMGQNGNGGPSPSPSPSPSPAPSSGDNIFFPFGPVVPSAYPPLYPPVYNYPVVTEEPVTPRVSPLLIAAGAAAVGLLVGALFFKS